MFRYLIFALILTVLSSCASKSHKNISKADISFNGGIYRDLEWTESLVFKRTSWFSGISMGHDILIAKLDKGSKFSNWLGKTEKEYLDKCKSLYVTVAYTKLGESNSMAFMMAEIENSGLKELSVSTFANNLKSHSDYEAWNLKFHKISAFCFDNPGSSPKKITVAIPSYKTSNILK